MADLETTIRDSFRQLFNENKDIESVFKKVKAGTATYEEANTFAKAIDDIMQQSFLKADFTADIPLDEIKRVLKGVYGQQFNLASLMAETAQETINDLAGVGLNPVKPAQPNGKLLDAQLAFENAEDYQTAKERVARAMNTYAQETIDKWVETNADFQKKAGMGTVIVRKYEGAHYDPHKKGGAGWKDCEYCKNLAGIYEYDERPDNVFSRHEGCKCTVSYYAYGENKGQITALAKGEMDIENVLYNTGVYTSETKKAIRERKRKQVKREKYEKALNAEW